ncbi:hypothetical protein AC579_394 [Pseudocercospora musae]|uniref:Uncharacterized protein n=1 Tax=Pseudocercospora musae TaxID=113226 RepID=A0A139I366_9PEZI|nr:hypothetical protein AC579_394 [Pseudocercospora musae]
MSIDDRMPPIAACTLGTVSVSWNYHQGIPTVTYEAAHVTNLTGPVDNSCVNCWRCGGNLRSNNDVSGVGVAAAFLAAAWASFALLACAYWIGVLPPAQLRSADRIYFFGNSRRYHLAWRNTIERVALIISDQKLVTGLGMLIAGFYEA